ncbi:MAG: hypothetical protein HQK53_09980 [Oligoflexia bacterium]|nr:hypothetical protein [Oligoflexia bacterium]
MGEGSALLLLESLEHAKARCAYILAEVVGYASSVDGYSVSHPDPEGLAVIHAHKQLFADGVIHPQDVEYINAHGTSTVLNDVIETNAIKKVYGQHAYTLKISSNKSMIGHLVAAAGAVEIIATILSLQKGIIFPTINLVTSDPECDLDYVANSCEKKDIDLAISQSFGLGGQNAIVALKKWRGV